MVSVVTRTEAGRICGKLTPFEVWSGGDNDLPQKRGQIVHGFRPFLFTVAEITTSDRPTQPRRKPLSNCNLAAFIGCGSRI
jgi:hypothetical protein